MARKCFILCIFSSSEYSKFISVSDKMCRLQGHANFHKTKKNLKSNKPHGTFAHHFQDVSQSGKNSGTQLVAPLLEHFRGYISPLELHFPSKLNATTHVAREASPSDIKQLKHKERISCMCCFFREISPDILFLFNSSNLFFQFQIIFILA